ncbi:MAG: hypothetical protein HQM09_17610 [Candidatus Riflebacteria bacterium]|nr:hypothetical protein [Candidatus Riflebacteria bacterium]
MNLSGQAVFTGIPLPPQWISPYPEYERLTCDSHQSLRAQFDRQNIKYWANIGGPQSRTRSERIASSLLGKNDGFIKCPLIIRVGLDFANLRYPVQVIEKLARDEGHGNPEDMRDKFLLPPQCLMARLAKDDSWRLSVHDSDPRDVLQQALILGLCSPFLYNPGRAVLWTEASLGRALELYDPTGFYE